MKINRSAHGFTLLELMTVIAVIALLFALVFPVFVSARHKVRETQCGSQMRQIVTALNLYRQDYDGGDSGSAYTDLGLPKSNAALRIPELIAQKSILLCPNRFINIKADDPRILSHYSFYDTYNVSYEYPLDPSRNVARHTNFAERYAQDNSFPAVSCVYHDIAFYRSDATPKGGPKILGIGLNGTLKQWGYYDVWPREHPGL